MNVAIEQFVEDARAVTIADAALVLGLKLSVSGQEHAQPCPACGGRDGFAFNTLKNKWNCRHGGIGGNDAIGMAAHIHGLDLKRRDNLLEACALVTGLPVPNTGERESDQAKEQRLARLDEVRRANAIKQVATEKQAANFREVERNKARGIYDRADILSRSSNADGRAYLQARCGGWAEASNWLRFAEQVPYWHGGEALHEGPAMIAPFFDSGGDLIGCHVTWIEIRGSKKLRPVLHDPTTGEDLPTKKMRGSKKGGIIPLSGSLEATRWVGGEGIENGMTVAACESFRSDTFYFAAGDLGNLAGQADPASRFAHPALTKADKNQKQRPVMIAGPVPKVGQGVDEAMFVPDHVSELLLLGDGDSEVIMTASAMARAKARLFREGRMIGIAWPPAGMDFSDLYSGAA